MIPVTVHPYPCPSIPLTQVQCEDGSLLQVNDEQIYSLKEKLPRKVQVKVKVGHSLCIPS